MESVFCTPDSVRLFLTFARRVHWQSVDGDLVTTFKIYYGTHLGEFLGVPPTGKAIRFETVDAMRVRDGKITEHWGVANLYGVMQAARTTTGLNRFGPPSGERMADPFVRSDADCVD